MVSQVFAQCQFTVSLQARQYFNLVEEIHHHLCAFLETVGITRSPPVGQVSVFVELTALVVESMRHFVTDYYTDGTIVGGIVSFHVEERRLKNSSRETDFVS